MAKRFKNLTEREILALGIQLEEEDSRVYGDFAEGLRESYPGYGEDLRRDAGGGIAAPPGSH